MQHLTLEFRKEHIYRQLTPMILNRTFNAHICNHTQSLSRYKKLLVNVRLDYTIVNGHTKHDFNKTYPVQVSVQRLVQSLTNLTLRSIIDPEVHRAIYVITWRPRYIINKEKGEKIIQQKIKLKCNQWVRTWKKQLSKINKFKKSSKKVWLIL